MNQSIEHLLVPRYKVIADYPGNKDFPELCMAMIKMLHKAKASLSFHELSLKGFKILPVNVSMVYLSEETKN